MPVTNPVLQNSVEERRPFRLWPARIVPRELDHRILYEVERFVPVTYRDFGEAQRTALHARKELVELPFALQRHRLFRLLAAARYRKNACVGAHLPLLPARRD